MDSHWPDPPAPPDPPGPPALSEAQTRFTTCRWQRAADGDQPACCGHRDVLPMAGVTGFNPESWCLDCGYYKAKRAPKARPAPRPYGD
ncbi:MAG: hypothetical protein R2745_20360 [Vicinamibacterales bacterium]